ncbi:hypothetical protein L1887_63521 [Cichorium endivia]|nr:hypothetical protein L1887_63521 [Cichorium endivia]
MGIVLHGGPHDSSVARAWPTTRAFGGRGPYCWSAKQAAGTRVASSPDSDLEAFSHNPAHGSFAPLAFQPSAMTNCANQRFLSLLGLNYYCDTVISRSRHRRIKKQRRYERLAAHKPVIPVVTFLTPLASNRRSKRIVRPRFHDVPPSPNSPPDNVFRPDRPAEAGLGSKKRGIAPLPIHGISKITLKVVVFHFRPRAPTYTTPLNRIPLVRTSSELAVRRPGKAPKEPFPVRPPGRHAATRSRRGSSSSSPPTADGFGTGTPVPSPQSQSFSRGYGSILPTSLAYIVPSTRGCSPWRPDAVMSTTGRGRHSVLRIFKGRGGAPDTARRAVLFQPLDPTSD